MCENALIYATDIHVRVLISGWQSTRSNYAARDKT